MIVVSKLGKPKHLRHVIHKDHRGSLTEVLSKKKLNLILIDPSLSLQKKML
jgi:hypothetical protein